MKRILWDVDTQVDFVHGDGKPSAKVGRHFRENPRLELVT